MEKRQKNIFFGVLQLEQFCVTSKNSQWMNILFVVQKQSSRQTATYFAQDHLSRMPPETSHFWWQSMSCLHTIRTCSLATCTHLDATNGTNETQILNCIPFYLD